MNYSVNKRTKTGVTSGRRPPGRKEGTGRNFGWGEEELALTGFNVSGPHRSTDSPGHVQIHCSTQRKVKLKKKNKK